MAKNSKTITPSLLGYQRSIEPTIFAMYSKIDVKVKEIENGKEIEKIEEQLVPIVIEETTARGTVANYSPKDKPADRVGISKNAIDAANIQTIQTAKLPADCDTLIMKGSVRFGNHSYSPVMHDSQGFVDSVNEFLSVYEEKNGFTELATRYMLNLACGRFMWRNRYGDNRIVKLNFKGDNKVLVIGENEIDMSEGMHAGAIMDIQKREHFNEMVAKVAKALGSKTASTIAVEVEARIEFGKGAEVYPSQEFGLADDKAREDAPSKVLASALLSDRKTRQAVMHPQKIGNAVRTIDTWHGDESVEAIAVEPFGANTHMKRAHRVNGNDFYTYFINPEKLKEEAHKSISDHHHFVVACLIRGGAYQMGEGKEK